MKLKAGSWWIHASYHGRQLPWNILRSLRLAWSTWLPQATQSPNSLENLFGANIAAAQEYPPQKLLVINRSTLCTLKQFSKWEIISMRKYIYVTDYARSRIGGDDNGWDCNKEDPCGDIVPISGRHLGCKRTNKRKQGRDVFATQASSCFQTELMQMSSQLDPVLICCSEVEF